MVYPHLLSRWTAVLPALAITAVTAAPTDSAPNPASCGLVAPAMKPTVLQGRQEYYVPAKMATDCLRSVPITITDATHLVASVKAYTTWQSTLAWLKDPPASYTMPPVDVLGALDALSAAVTAGKYTNEFDFQLDLVRTLASAHDGHFAFAADVFQVFKFRIPGLLDLVSLSTNGTDVPKLYVMSQVNKAPAGTMPPAVVKINGEDAAKVVQRDEMTWSQSQDRDANWNSDMVSYAQADTISFTAAPRFYTGDKVTVTYDNDKTEDMDTIALVRKNMTGIKTGADFYGKFCNATAARLAAAASAAGSDSPSGSPPALPPVPPNLPGFPMPIIRDNGANVTSGYFLSGSGYDDVAVLSLLGFSSPNDDFDMGVYLNNFQQILAKFLAACKTANKKRLVIDLTANYGGAVSAGLEVYRQLFPGAPMNGKDNIRAAPSVLDVAHTANKFMADWMAFDPKVPIKNDPASIARAQALSIFQDSAIIPNLVPGDLFSPTGANLTTEAEILAQVPLHGDSFLAYQQLPLNQSNSFFNLTGVGNRANPPPAVFDPANIVLLTDGQCASTCTIMSYLLIFQQKVKTVVVGGRPMTGPMQSIAGVEGAQVFFWSDISAVATATVELAPDLAKSNDDLRLLDEGYANFRTANTKLVGDINAKNAFGPIDNEIPLQFLYQAANCRFFWTNDTVMNPDATWKRAVDATWTDPAKYCVPGSRVPLSMTTSGKVAVEMTVDKAISLGQ